MPFMPSPPLLYTPMIVSAVLFALAGSPGYCAAGCSVVEDGDVLGDELAPPEAEADADVEGDPAPDPSAGPSPPESSVMPPHATAAQTTATNRNVQAELQPLRGARCTPTG